MTREEEAYLQGLINQYAQALNLRERHQAAGMPTPQNISALIMTLESWVQAHYPKEQVEVIATFVDRARYHDQQAALTGEAVDAKLKVIRDCERGLESSARDLTHDGSAPTIDEFKNFSKQRDRGEKLSITRMDKKTTYEEVLLPGIEEFISNKKYKGRRMTVDNFFEILDQAKEYERAGNIQAAAELIIDNGMNADIMESFESNELKWRWQKRRYEEDVKAGKDNIVRKKDLSNQSIRKFDVMAACIDETSSSPFDDDLREEYVQDNHMRGDVSRAYLTEEFKQDNIERDHQYKQIGEWSDEEVSHYGNTALIEHSK